MTANNFHGIYPMLFAFYDDKGRLDREAMGRQVEFCLESGAHGIACLGLGTEVSFLSAGERIEVMAWAAQDIAGRRPLAVTIAGADLEEVGGQITAAEKAGADWLILQPPLGSKPEEAELAAFFAQAMARTALPVGIQNAPEYLGVGLSPEAVARLADARPNFTVMKGEGPVCHIRPFLEATDGRLAVFNGRGGLELPDNLRAGCAGMVPSADSVDWQVRIYEDYRAGRLDEAYSAYEKMLPLIVFNMQSLESFLCYSKRLAARRIGLTLPVTTRAPALAPDSFGQESLDRFSAFLEA